MGSFEKKIDYVIFDMDGKSSCPADQGAIASADAIVQVF